MKQFSEKEQRALQHEISYAEQRRTEASAEVLRYLLKVSQWEERLQHWEQTVFDLQKRAEN